MASDQNFINRMFMSESSNNPLAHRKNKDGREYYGLGQFGVERLKDLGLGQTFTLNEFRSDPRLQRKIMDDHLRDIDNKINSAGLNKYEGSTVGGVPITKTAMYSMAHLGGFDGMKKFLETGGAYNPSDELGTSLSDYGKKFSGPTRAAAGDADLGSASHLIRFANQSDGYASEATQLMMDMLAKSNKTPEIKAPAGMETLRMQGDKRLSFGPEINGQPLLPPGQMPMQITPNSAGGDGGPAATPPVSLVEADIPGVSFDAGEPVVSTRGSPNEVDEEEPQKNHLFDRIARTLFGETEDGGQKIADAIGGIGVGLSQMSAGQPVDLQGYFSNLKAERQSIIDAQQAAYERDREFAIDELNAETSAQTASVAAARLAHEIEQDTTGTNVDYRTISRAYPEIAPAAFLAQQGDQDARKVVAEYLGEQAVGPAVTDPKMQRALSGYLRGQTPQERMNALMDSGLPLDQLSEIIDIGEDFIGKEDEPDTAAMKHAAALMEADPTRFSNMGEALDHVLKTGAGITPEGIPPELVKVNAENANEMIRQYRQAGRVARQGLNAITLAERANNAAIEQGSELSSAGEIAAQFIRDWGGFLGSSTMTSFANGVGIPIEAYSNLNEAKQVMMRALAESYTGQGTISDMERAQMANEVINSNMTNLQRSKMISRLKVANKLDLMSAKLSRQIPIDGSDQYDKFDKDLQGRIDEVSTELFSSSDQYGEYIYFMDERITSDNAKIIRETAENSPNEVYKRILPQMSDANAEYFKEVLNPLVGSDGKLYPAYIDLNGNVKLVGTDVGVRE